MKGFHLVFKGELGGLGDLGRDFRSQRGTLKMEKGLKKGILQGYKGQMKVFLSTIFYSQ